MGVTYGVMCMDCGDEGPELGDFGYIGFPSLDEDKGSRYMPNFGYIYKGLQTLGLLTQNVEDFREFLEKHRAHAMDLHCEGESMFEEEEDEEAEDTDEDDADDDLEDDLDDDEDDEDDDADDDEDDDLDEELEDDDFDEDEDEDEGDDEGDEDEDAPRSASGADGKAAGKVVEAFHVAACEKCGARLQTANTDYVVPFAPKTLTPAEARDAYPRISGEYFYDRGAEPFYDELPGLSAFLKKHGAHSVTVSLKEK